MTTYIPALQMYMRISDGDFGYASAVGVILFLVILVATFVVLRIRRNDGVEGA
jgi:ABC-type sugar transport system permease subunit